MSHHDSETTDHVWNLAETLNEITNAYDKSLPLNEQLPTLLETLVEMTGSSAGMLWQRSESEDSFELTDVVDLEIERIPNDSPHLLNELAAIESVLDDQACIVTDPLKISRRELRRKRCLLGWLSSRCAQLRVPVIWNGATVAAFTLFQPDYHPERSQWDLGALQAINQTIQRWWDWSEHRHLSDECGRIEETLVLSEVITRSIDQSRVAYDVVNELREHFGFGRISLAVFHGTTCKVKAVSGQTLFDKRSPTIARIEKLATKVALTKTSLYHPQNEEQLAPELLTLLEKYYDVADTKSVTFLPLLQKFDPTDDPDDLSAVIRDLESRQAECIGVIVVEGVVDALATEDIEPKWLTSETIITNAVASARTHDGLFLMPVWRTLGKGADLFRGHKRNKSLLIGGAMLFAVLFLTLFPGTFKLRAHGTIQPVERSQVYAQTDGVITELLVNDGQLVEKGQLLILMKNPELGAQIADVRGQLAEAEQRYATVILQRTQNKFASEEEGRERIRESAGLEGKLKGLREQMSLLQEKQAQLRIESPADGQVITFDVLRRLGGRPVGPGQQLLTVANPTGDWELELRMPDKRTGYLLDTWNASDANDRAEASYVLKSEPTEIHSGVVRSVAASANVHDEDGNVVRVYVSLDEKPVLGKVRPGTEVIAHVHAGRRSIGYCKLYEFFDWCNRLWFSHI